MATARENRAFRNGRWQHGTLLLLMLAVLVLLPWLAMPARAAAEPLFKRPIRNAVIITINGEIDDVTYSSLKRRVVEAENAGATLIIYRLNTYGGLLTSALNISKFTKSIRIPVVAYVDTKAYSAGSLIAVACRYIVMAPHAAIGDCEPISIVNGAMHEPSKYIRAKITSPLLAEFANSARRNGYNPVLLEGMVLRKLRIEEMRNSVTHAVRYVTVVERNKLLALTQKQPGGQTIHPWRFVKEVKRDGQLLTVDTHSAMRLGLCKFKIRNMEQLRADLNIAGARLPVLRLNWVEHLTRFVAGWGVRAALFIIMLICGYLEFTHPGLLVPGLIALVCLGLLVGVPYMTGLARWWEILVILLGVAIVIVDLVFYGGIGLLAIPGFLLIAIGIVASFIPAVPGQSFFSTVPQSLDALQMGLSVVVFGTAAALVVLVVFAPLYITMAPGLRHLQVTPTAAAPAGNIPLNALNQAVADAVFPGAIGLAVSDLRPSGRARFDQHLLNVLADGQFIPQNTPVEVITIRGTQVLVRKHAGTAATTPA